MIDKQIIANILKNYEQDYVSFMDVKVFPTYDLQLKEASLDNAEDRGYEPVAQTYYDFQNNAHILIVSTNLPLDEYLFFHEFTHILDADMYAKTDKLRYAGLHGFTEYHASQAELLKLLGAKSISDKLSFSMSDHIEALGRGQNVQHYVDNKYRVARELFLRTDFPKDIETLKSAYGVLFNYWGLRSICEMCATDFKEEVNNEPFLRFTSSLNFALMNGLMHGWLSPNNIDRTIILYLNMIMPLIQQYHF